MGIVQFWWSRSDSNADETAWWNDRPIKVRVVADEQVQRMNVGNLLADEGSITIATRCVFNYGINDFIKFRGKSYVITRKSPDNYEVLPQNTSVVKSNYLQEITLQLFEVNSKTRNLHCDTPQITVEGNVATVSCDTVGAVIYYTVDGYVPSSLSPKYAEPFDVATADTVYALAIKDGRLPSKIGVWRR